MKRIINTILVSAMAALSFSCQMKEEMSIPMNESIVLDLSSGLTKAEHTSTESFVNHIDVFIFEAVSGAPATGQHYGRYIVNNASSLTLDAKRSEFDQSKEYYVYLVANSVIEESEFAMYTEHNTLLNKIQEDRYLHLTGLDATNAPKYFLMDAVAEDAEGKGVAITDQNKFVYQGLLIPQTAGYAAIKLDGTDKGDNPYLYVKYTIDEESFYAYYNLADLFADADFKFEPGYQNNLYITIGAAAINFSANAYVWETDEESSFDIEESIKE